MRKIYWKYPQYKCIICHKPKGKRYIQLRVFDYNDPEIADSGSVHGFVCFECAIKLFKEKLEPKITVEWK